MLIPLHVRCIMVELLILEDEGTVLVYYPTLPFCLLNHPDTTISVFVKPTFIFCLIIFICLLSGIVLLASDSTCKLLLYEKVIQFYIF